MGSNIGRDLQVAGQILILLLAPSVRADSDTWKKHDEVGKEAYKKALFPEAEREFAAAVKESEKFGEKDPRFALSLLNLGEVHLRQGKFGKADALVQSAKKLLEKIYGTEHPSVARSLNDLAETYRHLGLYKEADKLAWDSFVIRKKTLDADHPDLVQSVYALVALERTGAAFADKYNDYRQYLSEDRVKAREKAFGKDHPALLLTLLARAQRNLGDDEASHVLQRATVIVKKVYGDSRPELAESLALSARNLCKQNKLSEAEDQIQKALSIWKKTLGSTHPQVGVCLQNMAEIYECKKRLAEADQLRLQALIDQFSGLDDEELCEYFKRSEWLEGFSAGREGAEFALNHREAYLSEMVRRGGPQIEGFLSGDASRLEVRTALRRLQNKADPLKVIVKGRHDLDCIFPNLPEFDVALTNVDIEGTSVRIKNGGDYRSGRQARWRFAVRDRKENPVPIKMPRSHEGGGLFGETNLNFDQSWKTTLNMNSFLDLEPGDYTVRVQYHDEVLISNFMSTIGLMVSQSEPIRLHVQPRVVDVNEQEKREGKDWLAKLDGQAPLKIVAGSYSKWDYDFVKPDSAPGVLLTLGWKAVPILVDELSNNELTPTKRAWILALLFSITGQNDPRNEHGVLGSHEYREHGWQVWGGLSEEKSSGGVGFGSSGSVSGARIDISKQREFAKQWLRFKENAIVVRER